MWEWNDVDQVFGICKESMITVESLEKLYEGGDTVPGIRSSHHFVPMSSPRTDHKLTTEDESYVDIHNFNIPALFEIGDISPSAYVTCIYNSFWRAGMVILVDIAAGDIVNINSCILMGHERPLISINVVIHAMFLWKTLSKRYQLLLHLLGEPTR